MAAKNGAAALDVADLGRKCAARQVDSAAGGPERRAAEFAISGAGGVPARRGLRNPTCANHDGYQQHPPNRYPPPDHAIL